MKFISILSILILLFIAIAGCTPPPGTRYYGVQTIRRDGNSAGFLRVSSDSSKSDAPSVPVSGKRNIIVKTAKSCIGIRYRYGGKDKRGFDCSGLAIYSYNKTGLKLPRSARAQYYKGKKIPIRSARPGDLVFFRTRGGRVSHVGIYLGNSKFVHAPSRGKRVRIDSVKSSYWRRTYIGAATYMK